MREIVVITKGDTHVSGIWNKRQDAVADGLEHFIQIRCCSEPLLSGVEASKGGWIALEAFDNGSDIVDTPHRNDSRIGIVVDRDLKMGALGT